MELSAIKLFLSAPIILYWKDNTLWQDVDGQVWKYTPINYSTWLLIRQDALNGSDSSLKMFTQYIIPVFDRNIPNDADTVTLYTSQPITMYKVDSSNIEYVGYDYDNQELYVQYQGGEVYRYPNVTPDVWSGLQQADSKGSFIHWWVKINHESDYEKVPKSGLYYSNDYTVNTGSPHPDGYLTGF